MPLIREDLITPCVALLNRLCLDQVPEDWVSNVWENQFTEATELPPDYEEAIQGVDVVEVFSQLRKMIERWIASQEEREGAGAEESNETTHSVDLYRLVI